MRELELFSAALRITDPAARAAYLDEACAGDAALRQRLDVLLQAHDAGGSFLEKPAVPGAGTVDETPPPAEGPGTRVGPYKLLQQLGEGGMGTVWVAEQTEPVKRRVALKVIKAGMDSAQVVRRFEAERQALALMDHTNIARVFDAGTTAQGRPYFVMELVKGVPITKYCDELHLPLRERLALFVPVCQAIQHAHQKGIIHRDVKPSNVLVAMQDGKPVPKVIDFGVAKALHQRLTDESIYTEIGAVVGTLEYMSPEQAELRALDIDTRADVYALGVLLYELLTGTTPLERKRLRQAAYTEVLRLIREEEPPRPSTRLTDSKDALASLAARRRTEPAKLTKEVRGELDWIVMKCLEKDRTRRYETANGLARDIERHLGDEPVEACPPGRAYRLGKMLRRHRAGVLTAAAFALLLLCGVAVSAWQAVRATSAEAEARANERQALTERDQKEQARKEAVANEVKALAAAAAEKKATAAEAVQRKLAVAAAQAEAVQRKKAEAAALAESKARVAEAAQRRQAEAVASLLESVFKGLDPKEAAYDLKKQLVDRLDAVAASLDKDYDGEPLVRARLRSVLGVTRLSLVEAAKAVVLFEQALAERRQHLPPDHPDTLHSMDSLARTYQEAGQLDKALSLFEQTLEKRKAKLPPDHPDTLTSMNNLATAYYDTRQLDKALRLYELTLAKRKAKLPPGHPDTLQSMNNLALALMYEGQPGKALKLLEQVLEKRKVGLPPDHHDTLQSMNNLATAYQAVGQLGRALTLLEQTLEKMQATLGPDHPMTLHTMNNLAAAFMDDKQLAKGLLLLEQALEKARAKLGPDHPQTLLTLSNLALAYLADKQLKKALPFFGLALEGQKAKLGLDHPDTLRTMSGLALAYQAAEKFDRAEPLFRELVERGRKKELPKAIDIGGLLAAYGSTLLKLRQDAEAEPVLRECLAIRAEKAPDSWQMFNTQSLLGSALLGQKKYAEAEPLLLKGYEGMKQRAAKIPAMSKNRLTEALERLVALYEATGQEEQAAAWRKQLDAARKSKSKAPAEKQP